MTGDRRSVSIRLATTEADLLEIKRLFEEYASWLGDDICFTSLATELASLPGAYAPPQGVLYLACVDGGAMGCVAVRRFDEGRGEMKRLFVRDGARGLGLGRALVLRAVEWSKEAGYRTLLLDTLPRMHAAQRMYEDFGFRDIPPYPEKPIPGARCLALDLARV